MTNNEVINSFKETCLKFIGNSNSLHSLGLNSRKLEKSATEQINNLLKTNKEVIYTSSRNEANSLVIFGYLDKYRNKNKEIILFKNMDASITKPLEFLEKHNIKVTTIENLKELEEKINDNVVLVCTKKNNAKEVNNITKNYNTKLLIDISDDFDINFDYNIGDFITFDKVSTNPIKGIGVLLKNKNIVLEPLFHGGKSTTIYRSGTPPLPFIVALSKAIKLMYKK